MFRLLPLVFATFSNAVLPFTCFSGAQAAPFPPFDDSREDASLVRFRSQLADVIARKDIEALKQMMHPEIQTSHGGEGGIEEAAQVFLSKPNHWITLGAILRSGGRFESTDRFVGPYTFFAASEAVDPFRIVVIVGTDVNVREKPSADAKVIGRLSHETAMLADGASPFSGNGWVPVVVPGGTLGFVHTSFVKSPLDFRVEFTRAGATWSIRSFLAGD